ncbi:MAG: DUF3560 domain-containing protein [Actinomycetota bacterium]
MADTDRTYRERREARAERLRDWADKNHTKAAAASDKAHAISDMIPFGQPILVGHHSEGRHRRDVARITSGHRTAYEKSRLAGSQESRAAGIDRQLAVSIYRDDPDAVDQLTARLERLEAERARIKAYNVTARKAAKEGQSTGDLSLLDDKQKAVLVSVIRHTPYMVKPGAPFPAYHLSNLSGRIKATRDRVTETGRGNQ